MVTLVPVLTGIVTMRFMLGESSVDGERLLECNCLWRTRVLRSRRINCPPVSSVTTAAKM